VSDIEWKRDSVEVILRADRQLQPFDMNCVSKPLVFRLEPHCHGLATLAKQICTLARSFRILWHPKAQIDSSGVAVYMSADMFD